MSVGAATERASFARAPRRRAFVSFLFASPATAIGAAIVVIVGICALFAPQLAPHDPNAQNLSLALKPPSWLTGGLSAYPLGTDNLGRDILSRIIWGTRVASIVGLSVVVIGGTLGVAAGMVAGYFGGPADAIISRLADIQLAFPVRAVGDRDRRRSSVPASARSSRSWA